MALPGGTRQIYLPLRTGSTSVNIWQHSLVSMARILIHRDVPIPKFKPILIPILNFKAKPIPILIFGFFNSCVINCRFISNELFILLLQTTDSKVTKLHSLSKYLYI